MSKCKDIINTYIEVASEWSEYSIDEIRKSRKEDCTNLRHIIINLLTKEGISKSRICQEFHITPQNVNSILSNYTERKRIFKRLERDEKEIQNKVESKEK